jgi:hypothetical protein
MNGTIGARSAARGAREPAAAAHGAREPAGGLVRPGGGTILDAIGSTPLLAPIPARAAAGRLAGAAEIGKKAGEVLNKYKVAKHFDVTITDASLTAERKQAQIEEEARLDGIYVIRTPVPGTDLDAAGTVTAYKNLKYVERDFRHIKSDDLDLRPVFHRLERRVRGHVLICMLAAYLTWHLRQAWAPLTYTDEEPPQPQTPSPPPGAQHRPRPRPHASTTRTAAPTAASAGCSPTWAPSPATNCASPALPPPSPSSPSPPASNARPSNSSGRPSRSPCGSRQEPRQARRGSAGQRRPGIQTTRNFGLDRRRADRRGEASPSLGAARRGDRQDRCRRAAQDRGRPGGPARQGGGHLPRHQRRRATGAAGPERCRVLPPRRSRRNPDPLLGRGWPRAGRKGSPAAVRV